MNKKFSVFLMVGCLFLGRESYPAAHGEDGYETIVRLKVTHGRTENLGDQRGLSLMFERRNHANPAEIKWVADVLFGPRGPGDDFVYQARGWHRVFNSLIMMKEHVNGNLGEGPRTEVEDNLKFTVSGWTVRDRGVDVPYRRRYMNSSLFEWTVPREKNIDNLDNLREMLRSYAGREYQFTLAGFGSSERMINCCVFSCKILKDLGIDVDRSDYIRSYITYNIPRFRRIPFLNSIPFVLTGGWWGSFKPEYVVEELVKHSPQGTRIVVHEAQNLIAGGVEQTVHSLLERVNRASFETALYRE